MVNKSLYWKIALAFVLVAFITAALVAVFIRATSTVRLSQLVLDQQRDNMQTLLADYFQTYGSWDNLLRDWQRFQAERGLGGMGMGSGPMGQGIRRTWPASGAPCTAWQTAAEKWSFRWATLRRSASS